ncbi:MAG: hypothetical protein O2916_11765 [Proteobacteria bacterium]|nr:hypothetical protein [Pseudomonadota bacterium]
MIACDLKNEICGYSCTGYEGKAIWKELENTVKKIECESCREHAINQINFIHDMVNGGLGKPLYNESNFNKILNQANCIQSKISGEPS